MKKYRIVHNGYKYRIEVATKFLWMTKWCPVDSYGVIAEISDPFESFDLASAKRRKEEFEQWDEQDNDNWRPVE